MNRLKGTEKEELENPRTYRSTIKEGGMGRDKKCTAVINYGKQWSPFHRPKNFILKFLRKIQPFLQVLIS